ncbi:thioredoxin domain-containing protein 11 [Euwallacea fornicatus]|uniref:thioredoxin domain-containing protein 11 n=1 Tax=Euwallacea fornicatus TaxID=995702 RepID=UPI0033901EA7
MHLLHKCLEKAGLTRANRLQSGDKNEQLQERVDSNENHTLKDPFTEVMLRVLNLIRELVLFCLILMAYSAFTSETPCKVTKPPAAYPFFSQNNVVKDFHRGQIISAIEYSKFSDISFVMFYAPWDAESQAARKEFLAAAKYMKEFIVFTAVNCWQPGSECRNQYSKVYRWPVLIAYPTFGNGIQYNGPIRAPHMISFLNKLIQPVKKMNESILNFEEAFVVAELNSSPKNTEYSVFYTVALKYLEADYMGRISFHIKPVKHTQNKISLYLWNQVRVLDIEPGGWKVDTILHWIIKTSESPSSWAAPSGTKSLLLSEHLQAGPALILFTPRNPLHSSYDYYIMLQELAQEYKNCDNWGLSFDMKSKRMRNALGHKHLTRSCVAKSSNPRIKKVSITTTTSFLNHTRKILNRETEFDCDSLSVCTSIQKLKIGKCLRSQPHIEGRLLTARVEKNEEFYPTSMLRQDYRSMQNLRKVKEKERCRMFEAAEKLKPAGFILNDYVDDENLDFSTINCLSANHSLTFVAMDSLVYGIFAERLGVDLSKRRDMSAVVILNEKMESHYIMQEPITSKNLRRFIHSFSNGTLARSKQSALNVPSTNSLKYTFMKSNFNKTALIVIKELNSENFLENVLCPKKAVLVMYYSKQCSHCNGISYAFLTVARKLDFVQNLQFARIDGEVNILPWEYTMDEFPTILFLPADKKEESRAFPSNIPINVPNLLGFILANVDMPTKLHIMYSVCLHTQVEKQKSDCLATLRNETLYLIEKSLKDWRKSNNRHRQVVLHNLKQLRQLHFLFSHSPDEHSLIESYLKKLNVHLARDYLGNSSKKAVVKEEL